MFVQNGVHFVKLPLEVHKSGVQGIGDGQDLAAGTNEYIRVFGDPV